VQHYKLLLKQKSIKLSCLLKQLTPLPGPHLYTKI